VNSFVAFFPKPIARSKADWEPAESCSGGASIGAITENAIGWEGAVKQRSQAHPEK
jgi:hypothetical protein